MKALFDLVRPPYHFLWQYCSALFLGFPAKKLVVIGVTGTKGKSTVCEMLYAALTEAGHPAALVSTIRFVTPKSEKRNLFKMTMQGRGFMQRFMTKAQRDGATHVVVEISSEGARQFRHKYLYLDALIVTNIHPEHIESHGSFEKYVAAKRDIVRELEHSPKKNRVLVANTDSAETKAFLDANVPTKIGYSIAELSTAPEVGLPGDMSRMNALATLKTLRALGIPEGKVLSALKNLSVIRGRLERVDEGQLFGAIVDYAHTAESLQSLYAAFPGRKICVLGNTGGGRDQWKRPKMGAVADESCDEVILTNEDPYDEDPSVIIAAMASGMKRPSKIILDRREAIRHALTLAKAGDTVLVSGKGTDPYMMGAHGAKTPWDDATVVREELKTLLHKS